MFVENFGRNEVGCATDVPWLRVFVVHGQAEVGELRGAIAREQNVAQFEIAVNDPARVYIMQSLYNRGPDSRHFLLRHLDED